MCEASTLYPYREARRGDIAKVGTVPGYSMRGLFEDGKTIMTGPQAGGRSQPRDRAMLVCPQPGATLFIEKMKFILSSRMHNSEFANGENLEAMFVMRGQELAVGDGFKMRNGVLIPLTEIEDGSRVRIAMAFA